MNNEDKDILIDKLLNEKPELKFNRNFGIIAHVDAGKTTTTEHILVCAGLRAKGGAVHEGGTVTDFRQDEKERGITIQSASVFANWELNGQKYELNLVDTPGHVDFNIEVEKSLTVLDGAVLVIDGKEGVQTQTRTVFRQSQKHGVAMLCFINKLDGVGADFDKSFATLENKLSTTKSVAIQMPVGIESEFRSIIDLVEMKYYAWAKTDNKTYARPKVSEIPEEYKEEAMRRRNKMLDALSMFNDELADKLISEETISTEETITILRQCIIKKQVMAVLCGASFKNIGIEPLLNAIALYLPNPVETCRLLNTDEKLSISHKGEDFVGFLFNTMQDPYSGTLNFIRVYSGSLSQGQKLFNTKTQKALNVRRFSRMFADKKHDIESVSLGDIVVVSGIDGVKIGDTLLGTNNMQINNTFEVLKISVPIPVIGQVITPKDKKDADKLTMALQTIAGRDISLHFGTNQNTNELEIKGMGELHLEIVINQIRSQYGVELNVSPPSVEYLETINNSIEEFVYEHKKQSGGRGQYANIRFALTPLERGAGLQFKNSVVGGEITASFIKGVETEFFEFCKRNATLKKDASIVDLKMELLGGKMHSVDSDELSFKLATKYGISEAICKCHPILLEPIMLTTIEINGGQDYIGIVNALVGKSEGIILNTIESHGNVTIIAEIPSRTSQELITHLRDSTKGNASSLQELSRFAQVTEGTLKMLTATPTTK